MKNKLSYALIWLTQASQFVAATDIVAVETFQNLDGDYAIVAVRDDLAGNPLRCEVGVIGASAVIDIGAAAAERANKDTSLFVLNARHKNYQMSNYEKRLIFKPSWKKSKWLLYAKKKPHSVQLVVPNLDLRKAKRVWVRNKKTKNFLESVGFRNVDMKRIKIEDS